MKMLKSVTIILVLALILETCEGDAFTNSVTDFEKKRESDDNGQENGFSTDVSHIISTNRNVPTTVVDRCPLMLCSPEQICEKSECKCKQHYEWNDIYKKCELKGPACNSHKCQNQGTCVPLTEHKYNCSCKRGYSGAFCEKLNWCEKRGGKEFCKDAACLTYNGSSETSYCQCSSGEYFDYRSRMCKVVDMCPLMLCGSHQICEENECKCKQHFKWNDIYKKCELNFCETKGCPSEDMVCKENLYDPEDFKCFCESGFSFNGSACNSAMCTLPPLNPCQQICELNSDNYTCKCNSNFKLKADNNSCEPLSTEKCNEKECGKGTCIKINNQETCICPLGYILDNDTCVDQCTANKLPAGICPDDSCVADINVGFKCQCQGKYKYSVDDYTCTNRRMCSKYGYGWKMCQVTSTICEDQWDTLSGYHCICPKGFDYEDEICTPLCSIKSNQERCNKFGGLCDVDSDFKVICRCPPGVAASQDGICNLLAENAYMVKLPVDPKAYRKNTKPILTLSDIADSHKLWLDIKDSLKPVYETLEYVNVLNCQSSSGYMFCTAELQFRGKVEEDILNRIKAPEVCSFNNTINNGKCLVPPNLVLWIKKIESEIKFTPMNMCHEGVNQCGALTKCNGGSPSFNCTCINGFRARFKRYPFLNSNSFIEECQDLDECSEKKNACPSTTICLNSFGSYECMCKPGYKLANNGSDPKKVGCVKLCIPNPCKHGTCQETAGKDDFKCRNICETRNPCPSRTDCIVTTYSYECRCKPGYRKPNISSGRNCVALCKPNPCAHGKCKENGNYMYECRCDSGYTGRDCNFKDIQLEKSENNTIIVGSVLGVLLFLAIIFFVATVRRLRIKNQGKLITPS